MMRLLEDKVSDLFMQVPIIFVVHSMGGLVVKKVSHQSKQAQHHACESRKLMVNLGIHIRTE